MPDLSLAAALTLFTGILCVLASEIRLGVLANFLFRPILVGFLNGIALSIFLGQIGKGIGRVPSLVVIDTFPISDVDINGVTVLKDLKQKLAGKM